ncbi:HAMP domain-containing histidine kinase [Lysobacter sp. BMK333-48F3]|uniref:sensor histidine kinase n=1 Tax=Lysobacter sp. BMK333-48F3 TaxID=2867962 RepID=UPI001C8C103E|nr:HAMP domain-containing sensor histidine kinase [Lysobacter sp. BMK333-48F3]MBX9401381.1 HAMP domain-containing histidine kinase [Lysobacter sp. BMK333-48F3]
MSLPRQRLRNRLMLAFAAFALFVAGLFGLYAISFMYATEDAFFDAALAQEAATLQQRRGSSAHWPQPQAAYMRVHTDRDSLPADLRAAFADEPGRREFAGRDGRHYHLRSLAPAGDPDGPWLVAEVGRQLVVRPMRDRVLSLLAWSALATLGVALAIGYWLARRITAPLSALAAEVATLSPERLPPRLNTRTADDEVGVLAQGLSALIERTLAFVAREREFTRDASHELRTPLAVIRSTSEQLLGEPGLSAQGRRHLHYLQQSALRLEQTVTALLALAREDEPAPAATSTALLPLIEQVIIEQSPLLEHKPVEVDISVDASLRAPWPAPALHILLSNLIGNAFAHSDSGRVAIQADAGALRIANRGHAVPEAERALLHEPHHRRAGSPGHGLGLAIVQRLCERYRIDLRLEHGDDGELLAVVGLSAPVAIAAAPVGAA